MVTSAWSESIHRSSSPTFSRRDFMPRRGRLAFRRSSTVEPMQRKGRRSSRGGVPAERVFKSSHVGPYEGCVTETWKLAKARARHRLESPGYPSQGNSLGLGSKTQVQVVDGSTGHGNAVTTKRCGLVFRGRPDINGGRGIVKHLHLAIFCVARAKCGVLETDCSRTALFRISNSEPTMFEFSHMVRILYV